MKHSEFRGTSTRFQISQDGLGDAGTISFLERRHVTASRIAGLEYGQMDQGDQSVLKGGETNIEQVLG